MIAPAKSDWGTLGVYTPDQAARLLHVRTNMINRWVYGNAMGQPAIRARFPDHNGEFITFVDLVQAMAIRSIRDAGRLSLQKIRATVEAADRHGIPYPFARRHTTYVFSDDVVLRLSDGQLIHATGKYKEQQLMEPIVEQYLDDLGFDDRGLANIYTPMKRGFRQVVLTPTINFGAPTITPRNYTVETLLNTVDAEGGQEAAAQICNVHPDDVRLAVDYEKSLRAAA